MSGRRTKLAYLQYLVTPFANTIIRVSRNQEMRRDRWYFLLLGLISTFLAWAQAPENHIPGKFVQADLLTDNLAVVKPFYEGLFGWTFLEHADYAVMFAGDHDIGTVFQRQMQADATHKPRWIAYMSVPDVGIAQQVVTQHGGTTLLAPRTVHGLGTLGVFTDAEGAVFGAVHRDGGDPDDYLAEPGDWIWIELLSRDAVKAGEFYAHLAPFELLDNSPENTPGVDTESYLLVSQDYARAGLMTLPADRSDIQPAWLPFVRVESIADVTARVPQLGGRVLVAPRTELAGGKVAVLADPSGAAIGVLEWHAESAPQELLP